MSILRLYRYYYRMSNEEKCFEGLPQTEKLEVLKVAIRNVVKCTSGVKMNDIKKVLFYSDDTTLVCHKEIKWDFSQKNPDGT